MRNSCWKHPSSDADLEGRIGARAPPGCRTLADNLPKQAGEVRLVCQPALRSDVAQGSFRGEHESLRPLDTSTDDVSVRRMPDTVSECDIEVISTEAGDGRE